MRLEKEFSDIVNGAIPVLQTELELVCGSTRGSRKPLLIKGYLGEFWKASCFVMGLEVILYVPY